MTLYYEVKISAENQEQADKILNSLLEKKLITGGQVIEAPAHFLWKGKINTMPNYCTIWSYTTEKHKQAVINTVKQVSVEEVPMVWFTVIEGNEELLKWIEGNGRVNGITDTYMVHVFTDEQDNYGDAVPVVIDESRKIVDTERLAMAVKFGAPETVFINDIATSGICIMHLQGEVDFAGTPALAAAWLLTKLRHEPISVMRSRKGDIIVSQENGMTWVRTDLATMPPWHHKKLDSADDVERLTADEMKTTEHTMVWAWIDETKGLIRARTFADDWDIPEAEGNGSGSMLLAAQLRRSIEVRHGVGSVMFAKPEVNNQAAIGGRVVEIKRRVIG